MSFITLGEVGKLLESAENVDEVLLKLTETHVFIPKINIPLLTPSELSQVNDLLPMSTEELVTLTPTLKRLPYKQLDDVIKKVLSATSS